MKLTDHLRSDLVKVPLVANISLLIDFAPTSASK